jgi:cytochrome b pre-mRNA-processing protein 3
MLQSLARLFAGPADDPAMGTLYGRCVAQARRVEFYRDLAVPDTIDGRFDLLLLHVFLTMQRLSGNAEARQSLFDLMFADMDRNLREMGVGDMGIGKRIKRMISAFYGRAQAYENALATGGEALDQALAKNLYGAAAITPETLKVMSDYVRRVVAQLATQSPDDLLRGQVIFPEPVGQK